jgi:hypothetical protein
MSFFQQVILVCVRHASQFVIADLIRNLNDTYSLVLA